MSSPSTSDHQWRGLGLLAVHRLQREHRLGCAVLIDEEKIEMEKIETEMVNCMKLLLAAVPSAQFGAGSSEMIEIDVGDRDCENIIGARLQTMDISQLGEQVMEDDDGVEKYMQDPACYGNPVRPVRGCVLPVPDAHGKGEAFQREVLFVRASLSQIELREVAGGVLIYYHRRPIIVTCESLSLPDLSRDSVRCASSVLDSSSPILSSLPGNFFSPALECSAPAFECSQVLTKSFASEGVYQSCTKVVVQRESLGGSCVHEASLEIPSSHAEPPAFPLSDNTLLSENSHLLLENDIVFDFKKRKKHYSRGMGGGHR